MMRDKGLDILSVYESYRGISDESIMDISENENRIILTFDKDYGELIFHFRKPFTSGIVFFRLIPKNNKELASILLDIIRDKKIELSGKFTIVERDKIHQKLL